MSMFAYLDLDFAMLCAFCGLVLVGLLRPLACVVTYVPLVDHLDVTTCVIHLRGVGVLDTHVSLLHAMFICLPCLLCATRLAFFASSHLCIVAYMFMHESMCHPFSIPMDLLTLNRNLHISSLDTFFHVLYMLVCLCIYIYIYIYLLLVCLLACFPSYLFLCLFASLFLLLLHVHA